MKALRKIYIPCPPVNDKNEIELTETEARELYDSLEDILNLNTGYTITRKETDFPAAPWTVHYEEVSSGVLQMFSAPRLNKVGNILPDGGRCINCGAPITGYVI